MKMRSVVWSILLIAPAVSAEKRWDHTSEAGITVTGGNSESASYNAKEETSYSWKSNRIVNNARYLVGSSDGRMDTRNWAAGLRYERSLSKRFSLFVGNLWEGDTFAGYEYRMSAETGGKYFWWRSERKDLNDRETDYYFNELGYRYTLEQSIPGGPGTTISHFIRLYAEVSKLIGKNLVFKLWTEYLPDVADSDNYQLNYEASVQASIASNFALKAAYLGRFDNKPAADGLKKYDYTYTTSLVASF